MFLCMILSTGLRKKSYVYVVNLCQFMLGVLFKDLSNFPSSSLNLLAEKIKFEPTCGTHDALGLKDLMNG